MPDSPWTHSIRLMPHTPDHLRALFAGTEVYEQRFNLKVADGIRDFLIGPEVSPEFLQRLSQNPTTDPWKDGFAVVHVADNLVIGLCSFTGPPDNDGTVEIAYGIAPAYQGRGYATEAARALVEYAIGSGQARRIRAHTLPQENASTRVLVKCGFKLVEEVMHPEDGRVWRWERAIAAR